MGHRVGREEWHWSQTLVGTRWAASACGRRNGPGCIQEAVGCLGETRELLERTPARAEGQGIGQSISYFSVTVTEQQGQGDLKKESI